jgi:hypothetical protein
VGRRFFKPRFTIALDIGRNRIKSGTKDTEEMAMATAIDPKRAISEAEWQTRQQLAACYRVFDHLGWTESIYNHITLRVPGEDQAFLINPFGLHFSEVTASNLVKIDIDGNKLAPSDWPVNLAGFVQHSAFHRHLPDAHCIMHTHTTAGMAVASLEDGCRSPTSMPASLRAASPIMISKASPFGTRKAHGYWPISATSD